ncbi:hypothetical protein ABH992_004805 [Bradyrhizobium yuanmingense]|uniref:Uncharacterized protein n=1 Tax=Bradyrhizobium yuanmingense TaxID=108015 RepID=A0ABV4GL05_9BRAD
MAERQEDQPVLVLSRRYEVVGVSHLVGDAAIGVHRAFRRAGRAGRIDKDREIAGAAAVDHLLPQRFAADHVVAAERAKLVQRHHHVVGETAEALHVEHDDLLQAGAPRAAGENLVELLLVLGEDHLRCGVVDEILDLGRRIGRIDSAGDAAGAQYAHVGVNPFGHGIGDDGGDLAGHEADGAKRVGDLFGDLQPFSPARRLPDAELLLADRRPVAPRLGGAQEALRDRISDRQHRRSGHAPLLLVAFLRCLPCRPVFSTLGKLILLPARPHRHVFFFFQRRSPRAPASLAPR